MRADRRGEPGQARFRSHASLWCEATGDEFGIVSRHRYPTQRRETKPRPGFDEVERRAVTVLIGRAERILGRRKAAPAPLVATSNGGRGVALDAETTLIQQAQVERRGEIAGSRRLLPPRRAAW